MRSHRPQRRRSIIKDFLAHSTIDGLKSISEAHNFYGILFWILMVLISISAMVFFCTINFQDYFEYKSKMDLGFLSDYQSIFPAFTICNSATLRSDRLQQLFDSYSLNLSLNMNDSYSPTFSLEISEILLVLLNYNIVSREELIQYTYTLDIMLLSCSYNGQECHQSDFVWFYSYAYGSCYTFNAKSKNQTKNDLRKTTDNGGTGKLELQMYAQNQLYFGNFQGTSGLVVLIHDNQELPQIEVQGLFLGPNRKHILQYTKSQINYLGSPYTACTDEITPDMNILFENYNGDYEYSQQICYILSQQAFVYHQCNCTDPSVWVYNHVYIDNTLINTKLCLDSSGCVQQAEIIFNTNVSVQKQYSSRCLQECQIVKYQVISSSLKVPTAWNYPVIKQQVEQQFQNVAMPSDWSSNYQTYIDQNYVAIQVIKSTYNVKNYEQQPSTTVTDLISALGGQAVLWIGFSLIAIFELFELFYRLIRRVFIKRQKRNIQVRPTTEVSIIEFRKNSTDEIVLIK